MTAFALTDEQVKLLEYEVAAHRVDPHDSAAEDVACLIESQAFQGIVRAARAEAWQQGVEWAALECGMTHDATATDADNPYLPAAGGAS